MRHLVNLRKDYGVDLSGGNTVDLINSRMQFYADEFNKIFNSIGYINGAIYHVFYESPLKTTPKHSGNLAEILKFSTYFSKVTQSLTK